MVELIIKTDLLFLVIKGIRWSQSSSHLHCLPVLIFKFYFEAVGQIVCCVCVCEKTKLHVSHLGYIYPLLTPLSLNNTDIISGEINEKLESNDKKLFNDSISVCRGIRRHTKEPIIKVCVWNVIH